MTSNFGRSSSNSRQSTAMAVPRLSTRPHDPYDARFAAVPLRKQTVSVQVMLIFIVACLLSFYTGLMLGMSHTVLLDCHGVPVHDSFRNGVDAANGIGSAGKSTSSLFSAGMYLFHTRRYDMKLFPLTLPSPQYHSLILHFRTKKIW